MIGDWIKKNIRWFSNAILPIENDNMKIFRLIEIIRKGELFTMEDIAFIKTLPFEKLIVLLQLYNIQHFNLYRDSHT